jgi:DNA-binding transcriptional LysR family regulator
MDYNDVPLFVRVVDTGSFTAAADALGIPKSSVSRSVARLEDDLGVRLLQRTTRKLSLTDAGQAFFDRVRGAVAGVDEAADTVRDLGGEPRGTVRMTAPLDAYTYGVAECVTEFVQKYPLIHVELVLTQRRVDLIAEGFDLAVRGGKLEDSSLVVRKVGVPPLAMFASPSYLKARGRPKILADLQKHDCVLFRGHGGKATWTLTGPRGEENVEVRGKISVDEMAFLAQLCIAGAGIALFPAPLAREGFERGLLEPLLTDYRHAGGAVHVVLPSAAFVPTRVALLRDHLIERLAREVAQAEQVCQKHAKKK